MVKTIKLFLILFFVFARNVEGYIFDPNPLLQQASQCLEKGNFVQAIENYNIVYSYAQDKSVKAFALVRMADISALFLDQKKLAKDYYKKAIADFKGCKELKNAYFNLAMLCYEQQELTQSLRYFKMFIKLFPEDIRYSTAQYMLDRINRELKTAPCKQKVSVSPELRKEPKIRVLLVKSIQVEFIFPKGFYLNKSFYPSGRYFFTVQNKNLFLNQKKLDRFVFLKDYGYVKFKDKIYRGWLALKVKNKQLLVINYLPLEEYLKGVVPKEMSPAWPLEALKAQAVAARSYAYFLHLKSEDKDYDLYSDVGSQVYGGVSSHLRSKRAVDETRGIILFYKNRPVLAYFHAHSGGVLESAQNVWKVNFPYFKIKQDYYSNEAKKMYWQAEVPLSKLEQVLHDKGFGLAGIKRIKCAKFSPSGRVEAFEIQARNGRILLASNSLRIWLGPFWVKSTLCKVSQQGNKIYFSGKGYGHGVGMSQWGAYNLAQKGKDYQKILQFYYPGTKLKRLY
ncbi:MAG: SpoIID/LytB domain-containing protein [Desulfonauticus sp.]|nr:SpoIID/LytB domain-containing protein [Desulfonauticus sp.]